MTTLLPVGYFPPVSYFAYLLRDGITIERHEHFVKQSLRSRCTIMGANGPLNLLVPKVHSDVRQTMGEALIHDETDWKTLHWRSLESAYRKSPYFEYYEDQLVGFFETEHTHLFQLGINSIKLVSALLELNLEPEITTSFQKQTDALDLRNAWNKHGHAEGCPVKEFPSYIQVFSDRHPFTPDLSILDLLFCSGPRSTDYLNELKLLHHHEK